MLLALTVAAVIVLILLTVQWKLQPFIALVIVSLAVGLAAGMSPPEVAKSFQEGVGAVLGSITMIIALGTVIGKMLGQSGGAEVIARTVVRSFGEHRLHWAIAIVAFIVGLPVFFAVGLVLLAPIVFSIARESGKPFLLLGIPLVAGLSTVHTVVPPHPGIMAAIGLIKADVGKTLFYSILIGLPAVLVIGPPLGGWYARNFPPSTLQPAIAPVAPIAHCAPGFGVALVTVLAPIALMLLSTLTELVAPQSSARPWVTFLGHPVVALTLSVLLCFYTFGKACGLDRKRILQLAEESLGPIASVLLIIGAGGGFSRVLVNGGVGDAVVDLTKTLAMPPLVLGWLIAAAMRVATGSATVAITAAAGILAPVAASTPGLNLEFMVLALGAGSLMFSHVNDGGFWLVKEFCGLTVGETFKTWSVLTTILSVSLLGLVLLLNAVV